ncbi:MAG TPA: hypothetical protein VD994_18295, partial [Prosthecobacter sp.]|nr:hypothetical protein [Prosthecobacter sp.]
MNELAPGSMSLEVDESVVDSPPLTPEAPQPAPEAPPQAADSTDGDPEGTVVNPGGEKLVPLGALAGTRQQLRAEKEARERLEAELASIKPKAQQFEQIAGEWQAVQPLLQQIKSGQYQPPAPQPPQVNEAALRYAKDLDLYKPDGTPDVERAQRILNYNATLAQEQAKALVAPIYQNHAQQQSVNNFEQAASYKDKNGVQVDRAILQDIWSKVPAELSSQPGVASVLWRVALAETFMAGKHKAPVQAPPPPQFTESLGGNTAQPKELSAIDRAMMSAG